MKVLSLICSSLLAVSAHAAVENVLSMQRDAAGNFTVVCDTKGVVTHATGISPDLVRADQVCAEEIGVGQLEEGLYKTESDFCSQTVKWNGTQMTLTLDTPCQGTVTLDEFQGNWYRGKLAGYDYIYEVQVTGPQKYTFFSRDFGTQGDFVKAVAAWLPSFHPKAKRNQDPSRL
jgi:hypothetical protein